MIQNITVKIDNNTQQDEKTQKILQATTLNFVAMTSALVVGKQGGGEGAALNPVEGNFCGVKLIYQNGIDTELAESFKAALERKFKNFFKLSEIDMTVEIELT